MPSLNRITIALIASFALASCTGGVDLNPSTATLGGTSTGTGTGTGTDTGDTTGTDTTVPDYRMGTLSGTTFTAGVVAIGVTPLSAGGSSGVTVNIVDINDGNSLATETATVTFSSSCISSGLAEIDSPVTSANGTFSATYIAKGCEGDDVISASASFQGVNLASSGTINVQASPIGSIQFDSADPTRLGLKGSGQQEQATVKFKLLNQSGGGAPNKLVTFSLSNNAGGITISPASGTTNASGIVQTVVSAGTTHTPVRVKATFDDGAGTVVSTQSNELTVGIGPPDQDSMSLSAGCKFIEGWSFDGQSTQITLRAGDRFNNPPLDGESFAFLAEGGVVDSACTIADGVCSVTFTSTEPRPPAYPNSNAGRATILAYGFGEESFNDSDGDGQFDDTEFDAAFDLGEAFLDANEDGDYDAGTPDRLVDFDGNGAFTAADNSFNGILCAGPTLCSATDQITVRDDIVITLSGSQPFATFTPTTVVTSAAKETALISVDVVDLNGNSLPCETIVSAEATIGALKGPTSFVIGGGGGTSFNFSYEAPDNTDPENGSFIVTFTTPLDGAKFRSIPLDHN